MANNKEKLVDDFIAEAFPFWNEKSKETVEAENDDRFFYAALAELQPGKKASELTGTQLSHILMRAQELKFQK